MPETDSVWVAVLRNDASRAAVSASAVAKTAARRTGEPRRPATARITPYLVFLISGLPGPAPEGPRSHCPDAKAPATSSRVG